MTGLSASSGGTLTLNGNYNIAEPLTLSNATLALNGDWTNAASINVSNTTVYLGGSFTVSNLGNFSATNSTVYLNGVLDNTNSTLKLNGQSWILYQGDVEGGIIDTTNGASLIADNSGTLDGVTLNGTLDVGNSINGGWLDILDGLTLNGTALVGNPSNGWYGYINFQETESLTGHATVKFGNSGTCNALRLTAGGTTLTLGTNVMVEGAYGQVGSSYYYCFGGPQNVSLINQGTIAANVSGGTIYVEGSPVVNSGSMIQTNGGSLDIDYLPDVTGLTIGTGGTLTLNGNYDINQTISALGTTLTLNGNWTNSGVLTVVNGTLNLNGVWTNLGTISVDNTSANLGGSFTLAALGTFNRVGGAVYLTGTLDNTNTTLSLNGIDDSWILYGGEVEGGTIDTTNGASFIAQSGGTLDGVTLNGTLDVGNRINGGWLDVLNGLTLNGTAMVGNPSNGWYGYINFPQTESLTGKATVQFGNSGTCNALRLTTGGTSLTLGPEVLVEGNSGQVGSSVPIIVSADHKMSP